MNRKLMQQLEKVHRDGCRSLEEAKELIPGDWKLPKEADFQSFILQSLADWRKRGNLPRGAFWWKESASPYQRRGIPDILIIISGRLCAFEVKRPWVGRVSDAQRLTCKDLRDSGAVAAIVSFPGEIAETLRKEGLWHE